MALTPACIVEVKEAAGNTLSDQEIDWVVKQVEKRRAQIDSVDMLNQKLDAIAEQEANQVMLAALIRKKHTALTIIARDKLATKVGKMVGEGTLPSKAILAVFDGSTRFRDSVMASKQGFETKFHANMLNDIRKEVPVALKLLRDDAFAKDVLKEMLELKEGGTPGITKNKDAKAVADIFARYSEISRSTLNSLGSNIGRLLGWTPQSHDPNKLLKVSADKWAEDTYQLIDLDKSFRGQERETILDTLKGMYESIVTGRGNEVTNARKGKYLGPFNLARTLGKHRSLHFKDADSWITYNDKYGAGNIMSAMTNHQRHYAQLAAEMQTFGPNPEALMNSFLDEMQHRVKENPKLSDKEKRDEIGRLALVSGNRDTQIGIAFQESRGLTSVVNQSHVTAAQLSQGVRQVNQMSKLGAAVIAAVPADTILSVANLNYNGVPLLKAYAGWVGNIIKTISRNDSEIEKEVGFLLGEGFDGMIHHVVSAAYADESHAGLMNNLTVNFFKMVGLTGWTDIGRKVGARMLSANMGTRITKNWADLDPQFKFVLENHNIKEAEWAIIQKGPYLQENGNTYVTPDRVTSLDDEAYHPLIEGKITKAKVDRAKLDLEIKVAGFFADEVNYGMLEVDARTRRTMLQGTRPGTLVGEILRHIMQFKGWPIAFGLRLGGRMIHGNRNATTGLFNAGHLIGGLLVAGYASMTAKDYIKGYDRKKFFNPDGSVNTNTLFEAFKYSGAAGVYGDVLFSKSDYGSSAALETVAGPTGGNIADAITLTMNSLRKGLVSATGGKSDYKTEKNQLFNLAVTNTPYANVVYVKPVVDWLFMNSFRESLNPGFFQRQKTRNRKDYGQTMWRSPMARY